jgi:hypothetical protein
MSIFCALKHFLGFLGNVFALKIKFGKCKEKKSFLSGWAKPICGSPPTPPWLFRRSAAVFQAAAQLGPYRSPVQSPLPISARQPAWSPSGPSWRSTPAAAGTPMESVASTPRRPGRARQAGAPYLAPRASPWALAAPRPCASRRQKHPCPVAAWAKPSRRARRRSLIHRLRRPPGQAEATVRFTWSRCTFSSPHRHLLNAWVI